jgi:hypothetical protein
MEEYIVHIRDESGQGPAELASQLSMYLDGVLSVTPLMFAPHQEETYYLRLGEYYARNFPQATIVSRINKILGMEILDAFILIQSRSPIGPMTYEFTTRLQSALSAVIASTIFEEAPPQVEGTHYILFTEELDRLHGMLAIKAIREILDIGLKNSVIAYRNGIVGPMTQEMASGLFEALKTMLEESFTPDASRYISLIEDDSTVLTETLGGSEQA